MLTEMVGEGETHVFHPVHCRWLKINATNLMTTSNYKTGIISVTGVVANCKRSQKFQAGQTFIVRY